MLCLGNKAQGNSTSKWEKLCNETYCHSSFQDKFELSKKSVRFRFHVIHGTDSLEITTEMRNYLTAENVHSKRLQGRVATQEKMSLDCLRWENGYIADLDAKRIGTVSQANARNSARS